MTIEMRKEKNKKVLNTIGGPDTCIGSFLAAMSISALGGGLMRHIAPALWTNNFAIVGSFVFLTVIMAFLIRSISSSLKKMLVRTFSAKPENLMPALAVSVLAVTASAAAVVIEVSDRTVDFNSVHAMGLLALSIFVLMILNNVRKQLEA